MAGRLVLVIDDHWDSEQLITNSRVGAAVREAVPGSNVQLRNFQPKEGLWEDKPLVHLVGVRDFAQAEPFLSCPELAAVILDQVFDHADCQLLNEEGRIAPTPVPAFRSEQGFWIAERIAQHLGELRPTDSNSKESCRGTSTNLENMNREKQVSTPW